ncbi:MAG: acyl-CoA dehydratase activase, partial [bacterium]
MAKRPGCMHGPHILLGLDVGSVSVNMALVDTECTILRTAYIRHKGQPFSTIAHILDDLSSGPYSCRITRIMGTGSARALLAEILNAGTVNEVIAQARATAHFYPQVRTIIEIGGEDSKLICLDRDERLNMIRVDDFSMNSVCAAGTGSFLDQQASRLGLSIEEFGSLALKSVTPPRIAGRCSVFAKSDMIHLQQEATTDYDIVAGLCFAMARNFKGTIGRGKTFHKPISFQGGVAANRGMIRAFESVLNLDQGELIIPEHYAAMGAIGACILGIKDRAFTREQIRTTQCTAGQAPGEGIPVNTGKGSGRSLVPVDIPGLIARLEGHLKRPCYRKNSLPCLCEGVGTMTQPAFDCEGELCGKTSSSSPRQDTEKDAQGCASPGQRCTSNTLIGAFLGIDIGSISTNVVAIDEDGRVLAKRYLMTAGRPIEAVRQGLDEIGREIGDRIEVLGVGTTGSGRYLIADFVGGDIVKNEITAQARAAAAIDDEVDTIFEIGGQDSKYIRLENGAVVDFEMNKVCAAGTGSFLEEQAEKLGISIKEEFGDIAFRADAPVSLGDRCTVFMESDLVNHQQQGAPKDGLIAGLAYSICHNYLNRVVGERSIGTRIFFQGGVAFNKAVIAAFQQVLGKPIIVPPHHEVTGAIGVALIAKEKRHWTRSGFKGFDLSRRPYAVESFECKGCSNVCQVRKVVVEGEDPLFYGSRCERFDVKKRQRERTDIPDLFAERESFLQKEYFPPPSKKGGPRIGLPMALFYHELLPLWKTFFEQLGCEVILSGHTNKPIIDLGIQAVVAETCFPIKVAHGHILDLIKKQVEYIFLPSIISMPHESHAGNHSMRSNLNCPYVQTIPYTIQSAIDMAQHRVKLLHPVVQLNWGERHLSTTLLKIGKALGFRGYAVREAIYMALTSQRRFYEAVSKRGREILSALPPDQKAMVIVSRPYNGCDQGINLQIPKIFRDLGLTVLPLDFLPLASVDIAGDWPNMYWRYGRRILAAAEIIRHDPRLFAVYLTNFGCGPDSFIAKFFSTKMEGKPYLQMEIDEHSADAGAITRCEAFADSLANIKGDVQHQGPVVRTPQLNERDRMLYIPYMCDHAHVIQAAFESSGVH